MCFCCFFPTLRPCPSETLCTSLTVLHGPHTGFSKNRYGTSSLTNHCQRSASSSCHSSGVPHGSIIGLISEEIYWMGSCDSSLATVVLSASPLKALRSCCFCCRSSFAGIGTGGKTTVSCRVKGHAPMDSCQEFLDFFLNQSFHSKIKSGPCSITGSKVQVLLPQ